MKPILKLTLAVALALGSAPALALQLGQIRVKSALDEPLVAEIPVQLDNLTEAQGLSVSLASDADFARAGLSRPGNLDLHFNVVTDSTGHKIVLVTSSQPVGDPYLDFLVQVNTSRGRQLREYTLLLDPVIASTPPEQEETPVAPVQTAPLAPAPATPAAQAPAQQAPAPPPSPPAQPAPQPSRPAASQPAYTPPAAATPRPSNVNEYTVAHGDTLYKIARQTRPDTQISVDQMMLALQKTNPDAFYRDNINSLKSGAILRIPAHDAIDATSASQARAQVHRQYEDWRGAAARKATVVAETTATAPVPAPGNAKSASASDRLALVPPAQGGGSAASRPGQSGGTSSATVAGLKQDLATSRESLASLQQENADLQSRVKQLEDLSGKNQKLLEMKDAEIAQLQRKLAQAQAAKPASVASVAAPATAATAATPKSAGSVASAASVATASTGAAPVAASTAISPASTIAPSVPLSKPVAQTTPVKPAPAPQTASPVAELPWYRQSLTWVIGAILILVLILLCLLRRRPRPLPELADFEPSLADQFGESPLPRASDEAAHEPAIEDALHARIADHPGDLDAHLALCRFHYQRNEAAQLEDAAQRMREHVIDPAAPQWQDVLAMGAQLLPGSPLFAAAPAAGAAEHFNQQVDEQSVRAGADKYDFAFDEPPAESVAEPGMQAPQPPVAGHDDITREHAVPGFEDEYATPAMAQSNAADWSGPAQEANQGVAFSDDPVDTKLDLARAYLDMGDPAGARAMLEEVLNEGTQMQKDEAKRLMEGLR